MDGEPHGASFRDLMEELDGGRQEVLLLQPEEDMGSVVNRLLEQASVSIVALVLFHSTAKFCSLTITRDCIYRDREDRTTWCFSDGIAVVAGQGESLDDSAERSCNGAFSTSLTPGSKFPAVVVKVSV